MNRAILTTAILLLIGAWFHPLVGGAKPTPPTETAGLPATQPFSTKILTTPTPTAPAPLALIRGQNGYWRLARDGNGVWWFLSPAGNREFLNTVTTVQPFQGARDPAGPQYVSADWNGKVGGEGDLGHWAVATLRRVREAGFKGMGAWCNPAFHQLDVPITRDLNVSAWIHSTNHIYSAEWIAGAEAAIKTQVTALRDNPHLVGYYIDNELDWGDSGVGPWIYFNNLAPTDPNRVQVRGVIQSVWKDVAGFNADWNCDIKSWSDLDGWKTFPVAPAAYAKLYSAWLEHMATDYFKTTTSLIRKYDPNHLILGVRFKGLGPAEVARASRDFTDAQSLNYYVNDAVADPQLFTMLHEESGQPIIISEYAFHALDGRSGNRNTVGFAAQVLDQQARADGYRLFTTRLARIPYLIGADWFQWSDEPPSGRNADGEDVNFGIVDIDDRPYPALVESIRSTTPLLNPLHAGSATDAQADVWREDFTGKANADVPFLATPITLNGELSDWPPTTRLTGIRHSQTVGLDRSAIPVPNIHLGWTHEGLYVGMEVFDNDIAGAPADGWWWTKDNVEFWISTKAVGKDQTSYDSDCHQFFFVPNDFQRGAMGVAGQWHRPGDGLSDNLIPHPSIRTATRILADRYVVEMFIPRTALHGFDPEHRPDMAFNIHVRNFQHATDYFWSAPKEVHTQLRPNTWGRLHLMSPSSNNLATVE